MVKVVCPLYRPFLTRKNEWDIPMLRRLSYKTKPRVWIKWQTAPTRIHHSLTPLNNLWRPVSTNLLRAVTLNSIAKRKWSLSGNRKEKYWAMWTVKIHNFQKKFQHLRRIWIALRPCIQGLLSSNLDGTFRFLDRYSVKTIQHSLNDILTTWKISLCTPIFWVLSVSTHWLRYQIPQKSICAHLENF